jgi:hypothetical protein
MIFLIPTSLAFCKILKIKAIFNLYAWQNLVTSKITNDNFIEGIISQWTEYLWLNQIINTLTLCNLYQGVYISSSHKFLIILLKNYDLPFR